MTLFAAMLWDVLSAAGGTVALVLIVAIALGINAMTCGCRRPDLDLGRPSCHSNFDPRASS